MAARKPIDWEAVEREYRAGQLSIREIGRMHGVSHVAIGKRAKRDAWTQNLAARVREAVTARLVATDVTKDNATATEVVDAAAARTVEVVRTHRRDLSTLRDRRTKLMERYDALTKGEAIGTLDQVETGAKILESISRIDTRIVQLERQAFQIPTVVSGAEVNDAMPVIPADPIEAARIYARFVGGSGV